MDDDDFEFEPDLVGSPWSWRHVVILALDGVAEFVGGVSYLLKQDHNWRVDREDFAEQAALEIETLTKET